MTARVLADHFDAVTVLERDHVDDRPALHQSIPQGSISMAAVGGQQVMASLYPGFVKKLERWRCALSGRHGGGVLPPDGQAFSMTGTVQEPRDLGFDITCQSRGSWNTACGIAPAVCQHRVCRESTVHGLVYSDGRVRGVRYTQAGETIALPLISWSTLADGDRRHLDGSRRPVAQPRGYDDRGRYRYASTKFRVPRPTTNRSGWWIYWPRRIFLMGPFGDHRAGTWHVTLMGRFGNYPPHDAAGFLAFARPCIPCCTTSSRTRSGGGHHRLRFPTSLRIITNG
jgi:hypothetical protein